MYRRLRIRKLIHLYWVQREICVRDKKKETMFQRQRRDSSSKVLWTALEKNQNYWMRQALCERRQSDFLNNVNSGETKWINGKLAFRTHILWNAPGRSSIQKGNKFQNEWQSRKSPRDPRHYLHGWLYKHIRSVIFKTERTGFCSFAPQQMLMLTQKEVFTGISQYYT